MSEVRLHLVLGDEDLLVERAVSALAARAPHGATVSRVRAGEVTEPELAELLSPSLFSDDRVVVIESAAEAGKGPAELITEVATDLPDGVLLIVVHAGGGRSPSARAMVPALKKAGAAVTDCPKITSPRDRADFVRTEFRAAGVRVSADVIDKLCDAVAKDVRELAAAVSQLVADTGGVVDVAAVARYYAGRAEVTGFEIADKAAAGQVAAALEALRWAQHTGTPHVLIADALADTMHSIAKVRGLGRVPLPERDASELGMPPWKVKRVMAQARSWQPAAIATALTVVATANADVKGQAQSADYALEVAVRRVAELAS